MASDPTVSRLVTCLASAGPKALTAIRSARAAGPEDEYACSVPAVLVADDELDSVGTGSTLMLSCIADILVPTVGRLPVTADPDAVLAPGSIIAANHTSASSISGTAFLSVYDELTGTRIRPATKLGLPHLAEALTQYISRAEESKMGYLDFVDLVLSEELAVREDRRFRQGLRLSKLPHHKTLDDFEFSFSPDSTCVRSRSWPRSPSSRPKRTPRC